MVAIHRTLFLTVLILLCVLHSTLPRRFSSYRSIRTYRAPYTSYRSYTYRSYTYRSYTPYSTYRSPYRSYRSSYRSTYSTYRSYRSYRSNLYYGSAVRYSRAYSSWSHSLRYYYYYRLYFYYYYPSYSGYYARRSTSGSVTTCKNYESNGNGTTLGVFACPMPFEPSDFTYCCGVEYAQYCCKFIDNTGNLVGVIVGCILLITIVSVVTACTCKYCKSNNKKPVHYHQVNKPITRRNKVKPVVQRNAHVQQYPYGQQPDPPPYEAPPHPATYTAFSQENPGYQPPLYSDNIPMATYTDNPSAPSADILYKQ